MENKLELITTFEDGAKPREVISSYEQKLATVRQPSGQRVVGQGVRRVACCGELGRCGTT